MKKLHELFCQHHETPYLHADLLNATIEKQAVLDYRIERIEARLRILEIAAKLRQDSQEEAESHDR